ncbi:unnamed protein product, partial [Mesorhabditis spiculigera]
MSFIKGASALMTLPRSYRRLKSRYANFANIWKRNLHHCARLYKLRTFSADQKRSAVRWMVREVNITTLMHTFNGGSHSVDEQLFASLAVSEKLQMPGGYHSACLKNRDLNKFFTYITRHTRWVWEGHPNCHRRHDVCLYGIENLYQARKTARRYIALNKFIGSWDFAATVCMAESLYNRTHFGEEAFDAKYIANHSGNRYQRARRKPGFRLNTFTCKNI